MPKQADRPRTAIIHYWLVGMRGGERVLESFCKMYPDADIYTHVYDPSAVSDCINRHRVHTTFIQKLPFATRFYQNYLPLMPMALEKLDLRGYQLVISSESGPAKNVIVDPEALHLCYCHSPMRYIWDLFPDYLRRTGRVTSTIMQAAMHYLRIADVTSAARVDCFIANSRYVAKRIKKYWRRDALVVHPPVDLTRFRVSAGNDGYYLWLGQLNAYKRPDIAVEAFSRSGRPLVVAGDGPEMQRLRKRSGKTIRFTGKVDDIAVERLLSGCRALVFPGTEDFGLVPVEAMACGKPVIAYKQGGAVESVREGLSGLFFEEPSADSLIEAIERFDRTEQSFQPERIRSWAEQFGETRFTNAMREIIDSNVRSNGGPGE